MDAPYTFLSHASADKPAVEALARWLADAGVRVWLDRWNLVPGNDWQAEIERALDDCDSVCVFVGPGGIGPWQNAEMRAALDRRVSGGGLRVIPVLLPGAARGPRGALPKFLTQTTWVEFGESLDDADARHRLLCGVRNEAPGAGSAAVFPGGANPYRGLAAFDVDDAPLFFGREALVGWLVDALRDREARFLAVVGASGSGKSSLARAGLLGALRAGALPGSAEWPVHIVRPGADPVESLALRLAADARDFAQLTRELAEDPARLHQHFAFTLRDAAPRASALLLVDQFEEVFTQVRDAARRRAFIDALLHAAHEPRGRTRVIVTLRADFYAACAAHERLAAAVAEHQLLVGAMSEAELRSAIESPAKLAAARYEAGLVDRLLADVGARDGAGEASALPLLQYALTELWSHRRPAPDGALLGHAAYDDLGGIGGALDGRAEAVYERFDADAKSACRALLTRLVQPGDDGPDARRRALREEFCDDAVTARVLAVMVEARLLGADADTVEIAHEALLRGWRRLARWLDEERDTLRVGRRVTRVAAEWRAEGEDPSLLDRGARLELAEGWLATVSDRVSNDERAFVEASVAARARAARAQRRNRWLGVGALVAMFVLALTSGLNWLEAKRNEALATARAEQAEANLRRAEDAEERAVASAEAAQVNEQRARDSEASAEANRLAAEENARLAEANAATARSNAEAALASERAAQTSEQAARESEARAQRNFARFLATEATRLDANQHRDLRLLLGVEALRRHHSTATDGAVRELIDSDRVQIVAVHDGSVRALVFGDDGRHLYSAGGDGRVVVSDLESGASRTLATLDRAATALDTGPRGRWLATGDAAGRVYLGRPGELASPEAVHEGAVFGLAFVSRTRLADNGSLLPADPREPTWLFSVGRDGQVLYRSVSSDVPAPAQWRRVRTSAIDVVRIARTRDAQDLYAVTRDGELLQMNVADGSREPELVAVDRVWPEGERRRAHSVQALAVAEAGRVAIGVFDPLDFRGVWYRGWLPSPAFARVDPGRFFANAPVASVAAVAHCGPATVCFSDSRDSLARVTLRGDAGHLMNGAAEALPAASTAAYALAWHAERKLLASGHAGGQVRLLHAAPFAREPAPVDAGATEVQPRPEFAASGGQLLAMNPNGQLALYPPVPGSETLGAIEPGPDARIVALGEERFHVLSGDNLYRVAPGDGIERLQRFAPAGASLLMRDGRVVTRTPDHVEVFDADGAGYRLRAPAGGALMAAHLPERGQPRAALAVFDDGSIWRLGEATHERLYDANARGFAEFSPDGMRVAMGEGDSWRLLDLGSRPPAVWQLDGRGPDSFTAAAPRFAFDSGGRWLVLAGGGLSRALLWTLPVPGTRPRPPGSSNPVGRLRAIELGSPAHPSVQMAFDDGAGALVSAGPFGVLRRWRLPEALGRRACAHAGGNLQLAEWRRYFGDEPYRRTCEQWPPAAGAVSELAAQIGPEAPPDSVVEEVALMLDSSAGSDATLRARRLLAEALLADAAASARTHPQAARDSLAVVLEVVDDAASVFATARIHVSELNKLCWYGALEGFADDVLDACDAAVAKAPERLDVRDSRAVARMLASDLEGAAADLDVFLARASRDSFEAAVIERRRRWREVLARGEQPLDAAELEALGAE